MNVFLAKGGSASDGPAGADLMIKPATEGLLAHIPAGAAVAPSTLETAGAGTQRSRVRLLTDFPGPAGTPRTRSSWLSRMCWPTGISDMGAAVQGCGFIGEPGSPKVRRTLTFEE